MMYSESVRSPSLTTNGVLRERPRYRTLGEVPEIDYV